MSSIRFLHCASLVIALSIFSACNNKTEKQNHRSRIAEIDNSLSEVYGTFHRAGITISQPDVIMIVHLLRKQFNLDFTFPSVIDFYEKRPYLADQYFKLYDHYFDDKSAVSYPAPDVWTYLESELETDLNALTFWSMFCNKFPLDDRFINSIESKLNDPPVYPNITDKRVPPPEYWPLHAALQLQSAENESCLSESDRSKAVKEKVINKLVELAEGDIETIQYNQDISTEAMAMLFYTGNDTRVTEKMINDLLSNQLSGGGWSYSTGSESVSLHTSVLAMWVLLEYKESLQNS